MKVIVFYTILLFMFLHYMIGLSVKSRGEILKNIPSLIFIITMYLCSKIYRFDFEMLRGL